MESLRVSVVQFAPTDDVARNRDEIVRLMGQYHGATVTVLPEYSAWFSTDTSRWHDAAEPIDGEFTGFLQRVSAENGTTIVAGFLEREDDAVFNTVVVVDHTGVQGRYRKVHLYDAFGHTESATVTAGNPNDAPLVVSVSGWMIGVHTCYDLRFPESARRVVDAGAEVLVVPADWVPGSLKIEQWSTLLAARAIENTVWVVAADHANPSGVGHSMIVDPEGRIVVQAVDGVETLMADLDSGALARVRQLNPALTLRRYTVSPQ